MSVDRRPNASMPPAEPLRWPASSPTASCLTRQRRRCLRGTAKRSRPSARGTAVTG